MATATLIWTGTAKRMLVSCLCMAGASVDYKNSNVETSIRIRPLNSLALNEPSKFQSKNPGSNNPLSCAHKRRGLFVRVAISPDTLIHTEHICSQVQIAITAPSLSKRSNVQYNVNYIKKRKSSLFVSMSILATSLSMRHLPVCSFKL